MKMSDFCGQKGVNVVAAVAAVIARTQYAGQSFVGMIDPVYARMGDVVIQHVGRGNVVFHDPAKLDFVPVVGGIAEIRYDKTGFGCVVSQGVAACSGESDWRRGG